MELYLFAIAFTLFIDSNKCNINYFDIMIAPHIIIVIYKYHIA